ncbi:hypothetical protein VN1289_12390 [Helicobacter pylori]|nr:hypothetical protein VN1289_12390 [Helicobacter pylori]
MVSALSGSDAVLGVKKHENQTIVFKLAVILERVIIGGVKLVSVVLPCGFDAMADGEKYRYQQNCSCNDWKIFYMRLL